MYGFKPGAKPQEKAPQGKKIAGPGNGTSDSIKTDIPKGSYIMPADSTAKIGEKALGQLGKPVPVNVSNGEYQMPPEQVHAVGVQALNQIRDATHTPVAGGFRPQDGELYFADGGLIGNAAQYWAKDNANFEAGDPSFGSRFVRALNPVTAFGSAMGAMHTAAGNGDKTGMALAAAQAVPVFGAMRSVVTPAMGAIKAARAVAPNAARTGVAIAGSGAAGAMADTYGTPEEGVAPQQVGATFSDMQREPNIPRQQAPRLGFADGGSPAEEERKRLAVAGPSPQMGAVALGNERRAERMSGEGMYGKANADVGGALNYLNRGDPVKDAASAVGGFFSRSAQQARGADYGGQPEAAAAPQPVAAPPATTPPSAASSTPAGDAQSTPAASQAAPAATAPTQQPMQGPAPEMSVRPTSAQGINRIDNAPGLKSPLFTNLPAGQAVSEMQGGTVNSFDMQAGNEAMARANAIRGGAETQATGFQPDRGGSGGVIASGADDDAQNRNEMFARWGVDSALFKAGIGKMGKRDAALLDARLKQYEAVANQGMRRREIASKEGQAAADRAALLDRTAMQESGANARSFSRDDIDRMRVGIEGQAKGFEVRGLERMEKLYSTYENAKTPEERAAAAEQIRAISGKDTPNRYTVVPGGQEVTEQGMLRTVPSRVLNNQTGQLVDLNGQGAQTLPPIAENPAVQKIMQNTALSREERAAQIRALGYK